MIKFIRQELANYDIKLRSIDPALLNEFLDFDTAYGARSRAGNVRATVGRQLLHLQLSHPQEVLAGKSAALSGSLRKIQFDLA